MGALVQIAGALLILIPFVLAQFRLLQTNAWQYLVMNAVGSSILCANAFLGAQWGFVLLEGVWALACCGVWLRSRVAKRLRASSSQD